MPARDPVKRNKTRRRDYNKHKKRRDAQINKWKRAHPERVKAYRIKSRGDLKAAAFKKLGNRCANPACQWLNGDGSRGCTDYRCLQIEHPNGGGNQERASGIDTRRMYRRVLNGEGDYQLFCSNCNWIKRHEYGEHN